MTCPRVRLLTRSLESRRMHHASCSCHNNANSFRFRTYSGSNDHCLRAHLDQSLGSAIGGLQFGLLKNRTKTDWFGQLSRHMENDSRLTQLFLYWEYFSYSCKQQERDLFTLFSDESQSVPFPLSLSSSAGDADQTMGLDWVSDLVSLTSHLIMSVQPSGESAKRRGCKEGASRMSPLRHLLDLVRRTK